MNISTTNISNSASTNFTGSIRKPIRIVMEGNKATKKELTNKESLSTYDTAMAQIAERNKLAINIEKLITQDPEIQKDIKELPKDATIYYGTDLYTYDTDLRSEKPINFATCYINADDGIEEKEPFEYDESTTPEEIRDWFHKLPKATTEPKGGNVVCEKPVDEVSQDANMAIKELGHQKELAKELLEFMDTDEVKALVNALPDGYVVNVNGICQSSEELEFLEPGLTCLRDDVSDDEDELVGFEIDTKLGKLNKEAIVDWLSSLNKKSEGN